MEKHVDVTIVIVNWNGGDMLLRCLGSIRAARTTFKTKVIVIDNDSKDGSREKAAGDFPEFKVVNSGSNLGFGRGNNLARPMVDTSLVLFLNPDTEVRTDTLEKAVAELGIRDDVGLLGCKMVYPDGTVQYPGLQWFPSPLTILAESLLPARLRKGPFLRWLPVPDPLVSGYVRKLYGGFLLARRNVVDTAGWFDDRYFMYAEDVDLCRTVRDLGWKLYYTAEAEIMHVAGGTSRKAPSNFSVLMKCESINKLIRKYSGNWGAVAHRGVVVFGALTRLLIGSVGWIVYVGSQQKRLWQTRCATQWNLVLWAFGLRSAVPPSGRLPDIATQGGNG